MFGYRVEDTIGKNAPEFFQLDMIKEEINEKLTNFNNGKVCCSNMGVFDYEGFNLKLARKRFSIVL